MPTIVRKTSWSIVGLGLGVTALGVLWTVLLFGTDVLTSGGRISAKGVLLGILLIVAGVAFFVQGFRLRACSSCDVELALREGWYSPEAWPHFRAALDALRAGHAGPLTFLARSPRVQRPSAGMEVTALAVEGCPRCHHLAEVSLTRKRFDQTGNGAVLDKAPPVLVHGGLARHVTHGIPNAG